MPLLFGYGSLLSPPSVGRTLGRPVDAAELRPCTVTGYRRTWTAPVTVFVGPEDRAVRALFLDLSASPSTECNGVLLTVSDAELALMDARERGYERRRVAARLATAGASGGDAPLDAVTYVVPDGAKARDGHVLLGYTRLLDDALAGYPPAFRAAFWAATDRPPEPLVAGAYRFPPAQGVP